MRVSLNKHSGSCQKFNPNLPIRKLRLSSPGRTRPMPVPSGQRKLKSWRPQRRRERGFGPPFVRWHATLSPGRAVQGPADYLGAPRSRGRVRGRVAEPCQSTSATLRSTPRENDVWTFVAPEPQAQRCDVQSVPASHRLASALAKPRISRLVLNCAWPPTLGGILRGHPMKVDRPEPAILRAAAAAPAPPVRHHVREPRALCSTSTLEWPAS